jgi:tRNA/rRNA methyltransferase
VAERASLPEALGALAHWQTTLQQIGFLDPAAPKRLMPRLQQLLNRAELTREEVHILRGIARAVATAARAAPEPGGPSTPPDQDGKRTGA